MSLQIEDNFSYETKMCEEETKTRKVFIPQQIICFKVQKRDFSKSFQSVHLTKTLLDTFPSKE